MAYNSAVKGVLYYVEAALNPPFIPGNCQEPTNSHDNPDNGTLAQRTTQCIITSPLAEVAVAS